MAQNGLVARRTAILFLTGILCCALGGCANTPPAAPRVAADIPLVASTRPQDAFVRDNIKELKRTSPPAPLKTPDYQPVSDDISPAKTRLVNIQARNSALGDILHVIADAAGLNLVINDGVQQDRTITITLKRVTADDALATILNAADYFYTIKDNILSIEATGTKVFELGHPALIQGFNIDVGGDILGSASGLTASGSGSGSGSGSSSSGSGSNSGSGSSSSGSSNIKGTINQSTKSDAKAFDFWESLDKSLQLLLGKQFETSTYQTEATLQSQSHRDVSPAKGQTGGKQTWERSIAGDPNQRVIINRLTGTIVVTATRHNLNAIEKYLDLVKAALNRQVLVEARVIEVQLNDSLKFGIDWDFLNNIRWFNTTGAAAGGFGNAATAATNAVNSGAFRLGYGGGNVQALLTALKTQGEVKTLSNPRINVMNGQTALLTVGRNTNYVSKISSTISTGTGTTPIITYTADTANVLSGIMIGIAPNINSKGEIRMAITPIISDLVSLTPTDIGSGDYKTNIQIPIVDLRELSTTVKVRDGEMIVIGGLISNKQDLQDEKIPFVGDIPWLGTLFSRKNYQDKRTELVVVLQPYLVGSEQ